MAKRAAAGSAGASRLSPAAAGLTALLCWRGDWKPPPQGPEEAKYGCQRQREPPEQPGWHRLGLGGLGGRCDKARERG